MRRQNLGQTDPIGASHYDPWVYETSKENMGNFPLYHVQKGRKDIAEPKMEENTHAFANDLVEPLPYVRSA